MKRLEKTVAIKKESTQSEFESKSYERNKIDAQQPILQRAHRENGPNNPFQLSYQANSAAQIIENSAAHLKLIKEAGPIDELT